MLLKTLDRLRLTILKNRKIGLCEAVDGVLVRVGNRHIEDHKIHVGAKVGGSFGWRRLPGGNDDTKNEAAMQQQENTRDIESVLCLAQG